MSRSVPRVGLVALGLLASCGGGSSDDETAGGTSEQAATVVVESTASAGAESDEQSANGTESEIATSATDVAASATTDGGTNGGQGTCTVTVTGDREESWTFEQAVTSFSTDYWMSEEQLRATVDALGEDVAGGSYDEIVARGEPIITFLSLSCSNPETLLEGALIMHTDATRASDLPMASGSYPISGGLFDAATGPAATMIADFAVADGEVYGTVADSGTLEITAWDGTRIEGTFSFAAQQTLSDSPKDVHVDVTFSFVCEATMSGCQAAGA